MPTASIVANFMAGWGTGVQAPPSLGALTGAFSPSLGLAGDPSSPLTLEGDSDELALVGGLT